MGMSHSRCTTGCVAIAKRLHSPFCPRRMSLARAKRSCYNDIIAVFRDEFPIAVWGRARARSGLGPVA